jgi:glycosyltransferase involved in cell wall biosynthesis
MKPTVRILGIRGVPAAHGGFETFAERLAPYLVEQGWRVIVYCQHEGERRSWVDKWEGVERHNICVKGDGPASTIRFDWQCIWHAAKSRDLCLTLGYNTAAFCAYLRLRGVRNVINMDGIEWSRAKWGGLAKTWFWLNDWAGCLFGDHLVADHPEIKQHLRTRVRAEKITTIAYGADRLVNCAVAPVVALGLTPGRYLTLVARPEPENSILEVVTGFSRARRGVQLAVLGHYLETNPYHQAVLAAAGDEVKFLGAIYDREVVQSLRFHSMAYIHGHRVGGTNPSLVEALGAGNPVIAHANKFNRWVAGEGALYFESPDDLSRILDALPEDYAQLQRMRDASVSRFENGLTWPQVLSDYESLLRTQLRENE